ncbi:MAG TPA: periplasmic heavy metal sensor [Bryobacteraceae bacterium]|jgi:Spy/CpxP family protein refolding chaperone|nr:periplasmic heavy metal sensor [Bryobacteraceae bacterium]
MRRILSVPLLAILAVTALVAQPPPPGGFGRRGGPPPRGDRMEGKWWYNPPIVQRLGLTTDQQKKLEDVFQQNRLKLIDLTAVLEREQAILDPLLSADHPQESRVLAQFDKVAEARLDLEKANARMLWGFRTILTVDQWKDLQAQDDGRGPGPPPGHPPIH